MTATEQGSSGYRIQRGTLTRFVDEHVAVWEVVMAALACIYLGLAIRDDVVPGSVPLGLTLALSMVFVAEFCGRCLDAPSRISYAVHHWLDLVSCVPLVGGLRALRLVRLVRVAWAPHRIRTASVSSAIGRSAAPSVWFLLPTLVLVWSTSAAAFWILEHGSNPRLHSFSDALFWSFLTATTVGHSSLSASTSGGEVLTGLLTFVAIGLIGVTSSRLTAHWLNARESDGELEMIDEVRALRVEIASLRNAVLERHELVDSGHGGNVGRSS